LAWGLRRRFLGFVVDDRGVLGAERERGGEGGGDDVGEMCIAMAARLGKTCDATAA